MQLADREAAGWSSAGLEEARQYAVEIGTTSAMVLGRARVVQVRGRLKSSCASRSRSDGSIS